MQGTSYTGLIILSMSILSLVSFLESVVYLISHSFKSAVIVVSILYVVFILIIKKSTHWWVRISGIFTMIKKQHKDTLYLHAILIKKV